jgi:hypothetical protein
MRTLLVSLFLLVAVGGATADIVTSLELRWKMDENTGTTLTDTTGHGHTGTFGASTAAPTWSTSCHAGSCVAFDGANDVVTMTQMVTGTTFTWAAWVFPLTSANTYAVLFVHLGNDGIWLMPAAPNNRKLNYYYSSADHLSTGALTQDAWNHVAVVNNAGAVTFYINGSASGTATGGASFLADEMGADTGASGLAFAGRIDEVWYFAGRALSGSDITELMNQSDTAGLRRRLPLNYQ